MNRGSWIAHFLRVVSFHLIGPYPTESDLDAGINELFGDNAEMDQVIRLSVEVVWSKMVLRNK